MDNLIAIVGPTGVGKSCWALRLAQLFNGEVVSADSRQVYRYMDIGTAKPSREDMSLVPHHLIDIIDPGEPFGLAQYQQLACRAIDDIQRRGKLPFLVGGTGQYVWSVLEGWKIPKVRPDLEFRRSLEAKAAEIGSEKLYQELVSVDPVSARRIDRRNVRRIIRALEVHRSIATPLYQQQYKKAPPYKIIIIGLTMNREELYLRIDRRVDDMIGKGMAAEVKQLVSMGYDFNLPAMTGIGYRQIERFLKGELTLNEAAAQIKSETHRFVRHQYNWFRLKDDRIKWFNIEKEECSEIIKLVESFTGTRLIES